MEEEREISNDNSNTSHLFKCLRGLALDTVLCVIRDHCSKLGMRRLAGEKLHRR